MRNFRERAICEVPRTPSRRSSQDAPSGYFVEQSPARCERFLRVPSWRSDGQIFPTRPKGVFVSVELRMLSFSVVLGIVQNIAASHAARLQVDGEPQGREGRAATWCGRAPGSGFAQLRGDLPFVRRRRPGGARHGHPRRAHRVGSTALLLGSCGLRAPLRGRGPADPFAGVERRHDRHRVDRRCSAVWMSITFSGLGRGGLIACELRRIPLPRTWVNKGK